MNNSDYDNLRICDRYKNTQVYYHVEAFCKKIRKRKLDHRTEPQLGQQLQIINANAEQRQIDAFYKEGWQYEHAHSFQTSDISDPIYLQKEQAEEQKLGEYYKKCQNFIIRLKRQHEDETAFRVDAMYAIPFLIIQENQKQSSEEEMDEQRVDKNFVYHSDQQKKYYQNIICAKQAYRSFFSTISNVVQQMLRNIKKLQQTYSQLQYIIQEELEKQFIRNKAIFQILSQWINDLSIKKDENSKEVLSLAQQLKDIKGQNQNAIKIFEFMANFIQVFQKMKKQKKSCLFNFQLQIPQVKLTYLIHPLLLSIYSLQHKQRIMWSNKNEYEHNILNINFNQPIKGPHLMEDIKHFELSRIVLINFDGYQSEFNIEFAKNMNKHLMYISFPNFQQNSQTFNNRFFKKIMFNYARQMYENNNQDFERLQIAEGDSQEQQRYLYQKLEFQYDPEKYFQSISHMYKQKRACQSNDNIYVIPIKFKYLENLMSTVYLQKNSNASKESSHFIQFLFNDFLNDDICNFNPTQIVISYSGNINIKDQHFVRLIQNLARITRRKVLFFPNFTTKLIYREQEEEKEEKEEKDDNDDDDEQKYDNYVRRSQLQCNIDLLKKMGQFLKITSGTYNLQMPILEQPLLPRYKLSKINNYIRGVLNALSAKQYKHLQNRVSQLVLRTENHIINNSIGESSNEIKKVATPFECQYINQIKQIISANKVYSQFSRDTLDTIQKIKTNIREAERYQHIKVQDSVNEIQQKLQLQIASERYSEVAYVYFKTKEDKRQYQLLKQMVGQYEKTSLPLNRDANNLLGLYQLTLRHTSDGTKKVLPIYPKTQLHYRQNQVYKTKKEGKNMKANIMLMNHIEQSSAVSFAGMVYLSVHNYSNNAKSQFDRIETQKVQMYPITFVGMPDLPFSLFTIRCGWNYAETSRYYFLYWPLSYNFLQAKLKTLNDEAYQPAILNEMYICQIPQKQHRLTFHKFNQNHHMDINPRRFCSALELIDQDKIIILGGFYDKQNNYLSLQREITGVDASSFHQDRKCIIKNQKTQQLYNLPKNEIAKVKPNSYVRARRQYEFFQLEQLLDLTEQEKIENQRQRTYIMVGGFGEDFTRPYSLFSCNYYKIKVNMQNKNIASIQRKFVYEKFLTSNIKGYVKNNGFFDKFLNYSTKNNSNMLVEQVVGPQYYIAHRSVYSYQREDTKLKEHEQLLAKNKYFFTINIFKKFKKQYQKIAKRIGEYVDYKTGQSTQLFLSVHSQGNHFLKIRKNKGEQIEKQIYLEKDGQKYMLTHGSIISIDINFQTIFAIVYHTTYTNGKYVITKLEMKGEQQQVVLKIIEQFDINLSQHYLFAPKRNELLILHGPTFKNVKIFDFSFLFLSKSDKINEIAFPLQMDSQKIKKCLTIMYKDQDPQKIVQIQCLNLLIPNQTKSLNYLIQKFRLKLDMKAYQFVWQIAGQSQVTFTDESTGTPLHITRIQQVRQLHIDQKQMSLLSFSSPAVTEMAKLSQNKLIIIKISCLHRPQSYITMLQDPEKNSEDAWESKDIKIQKGMNQLIKVMSIRSDNKDGRKIWQMAQTIKSCQKSKSHYVDMEIEVQQNV